MAGTALSIRSERKELAGSSQPEWRALLSASSGGDAWRIIEAFSEEGLPFELEVRWSAGTGAGAWVKLTVAHASRLCIFAQTVTLRGANLADKSNHVVLTVADGYLPTANGWEHRDRCDGITPILISVPPFATFFHLHLARLSALEGTEISLIDAQGVARACFSAASQPAGGIPVGGTHQLRVLTTEETDLRGFFQLSM